MKDMEILNLTVKTKNSVNTINLEEDLKVDLSNLNEAFIEQPAKYAWWATVAAQAKSLVDRQKLIVETKEDYLKKTLVGELDSDVRDRLALEGEKITESKVTNEIYKHPRYTETKDDLVQEKQKLLDLQDNYTLLDIAKESMYQRKDVLISLGANLRAEGSNYDLSIKKAEEVISNSVRKRRQIQKEEGEK